MADVAPVLVAACGNAMAGDDAFGPAVAAALRRESPAHCQVIDLGMAPTALLDHLPGRAALIIVDAAQAPDAGDDLMEFDWDSPARPALVRQEQLSTHGLSIAAQIELARAMGLLPEVVKLIAAPVGEAQLGRPMDAAARLVERAAARVRALAAELARASAGDVS